MTKCGRYLPISIQLTSIVQISTAKGNSRRRRRDSSAVFIDRDGEKGRKFTRFAEKKIAELLPKKTTRTAKATLDE